MLNSRKGFTLVEMIVVMAVFVVVIMITADSFKTILTQMTKITKSEESNIEGVVGLEMFRMICNKQAMVCRFRIIANICIEAGYAPASNYNDCTGSTTSGVPRAVVAGDKLGAVAGATVTRLQYRVWHRLPCLKRLTLGMMKQQKMDLHAL